MRSFAVCAICVFFVGFSGNAGAALYDKGEPLFFQAPKAEKDHLEMLKGFEQVLKNEPAAEEKAVVDHGLKMFLQSPSDGYVQGKDFYLFLRFRSEDSRRLLRMNMLGVFELEIMDMTRAKIQTARYAFDDHFKKKLAREDVEVVSLGISEASVPEVNVVFALGDFNFVPPLDGVYRIRIIYHSESPDNSVWTGTLSSNPILISVGQTP
jgi:hypothetical protein